MTNLIEIDLTITVQGGLTITKISLSKGPTLALYWHYNACSVVSLLEIIHISIQRRGSNASDNPRPLLVSLTSSCGSSEASDVAYVAAFTCGIERFSHRWLAGWEVISKFYSPPSSRYETKSHVKSWISDHFSVYWLKFDVNKSNCSPQCRWKLWVMTSTGQFFGGQRNKQMYKRLVYVLLFTSLPRYSSKNENAWFFLSPTWNKTW